MKHTNRTVLTISLLVCLHTVACTQGGPGTSPSNPPSRPQLPPQSQTIQGRVVSIAGGDTLTVLDSTNTQHRIELQGIDAPESQQAFGTRSRESLSAMVFNREVTVEYDSRDRYQQRSIIGKVLVDGRDANLEQVRQGMAWVYRGGYDSVQIAYDQAEQSARQARRGLWADENPTPPWDYRRAARDQSNNQIQRE